MGLWRGFVDLLRPARRWPQAFDEGNRPEFREKRPRPPLTFGRVMRGIARLCWASLSLTGFAAAVALALYVGFYCSRDSTSPPIAFGTLALSVVSLVLALPVLHLTLKNDTSYWWWSNYYWGWGRVGAIIGISLYMVAIFLGISALSSGGH